MDGNSNANARSGRESRSLTTRRGFIAVASLGAVSLYGLWAAYGAAPFRILSPGGAGHGAGHEAEPKTAGHGEHGAARGPTPEEFRRLTDDFIARHRQADGSVRVEPTEPRGVADSTMVHSGGGVHGAGHDMSAMPAQPPAPRAPAAPADVYMIAQQWSFEPATLRIRAGAPYRFRIMAEDASHGASLQLGRGSRIIRLRRGALVEQELIFTRPDEYLVYCTVYCGIGHDRMSGRIIVA